MSLCASVHHWTFFAHVVVIVAIAIFVAEPKVVDEDSPSFSLSITVIDDTVCSLAPEDHGLSLTLSMTSPHPTLISSFPKFPQTHTHTLSLSHNCCFFQKENRSQIRVGWKEYFDPLIKRNFIFLHYYFYFYF